jgi:hypothetical protein
MPGYRSSYHEIADRAALVRKIYRDHEIDIAIGSSIDLILNAPSELLNKGISLFDEKGGVKTENADLVWRGADCARIVPAILWAKNSNSCDLYCYLRKILDGYLEAVLPGKSTGKDYIYELQMGSLFEGAGLKPTIQEPDLNISVDGQRYSVACKHVYGVKNLGKQMQDARRQIESSGKQGIICISVDEVNEVFPRQQTLCGTKDQVVVEMRSMLDRFCENIAKEISKRIIRNNIIGALFTLFRPVKMDLTITNAHIYKLILFKDRKETHEVMKSFGRHLMSSKEFGD